MNSYGLSQYQKGYADGYKRHKNHYKAQKDYEYYYFINVALICVLIILAIILNLRIIC